MYKVYRCQLCNQRQYPLFLFPMIYIKNMLFTYDLAKNNRNKMPSLFFHLCHKVFGQTDKGKSKSPSP